MTSSLRVTGMRCNYSVNPLGVETPSPHLSWVLESDERDQYQKAYRIIVASSAKLLENGTGDLWDSGKVESSESAHIRYAGKQLKSGQQCWWKVCAWDKHDKASQWSDAAFFEMGLLSQSDWKAKWICAYNAGTDIETSIPAPLLRKSFQLDKKIRKARVYICGLGYYELYINGVKIGDDVLSPAFTKYDSTVLYNTYDVLDSLAPGENVVGVILGNGWYNPFTEEVWNHRQSPWRDHPKLLFQMHVTFEDGEEITLVSDRSWKVSDGPIIFDGLRNGEFYDARREKDGWSKPGYDDSEWKHALIAKAPGGLLRSSQLPPIRITGTIKPVSLKEVQSGVWVYDLGQNISGWAKIKVSGPKGTEITLKYAEKIKDDGSLDQSNIDIYIKSGECQTDKYILKGEGVEEWEPRFTYHGFQYVQVTGFPGTPALDSLVGRVVHTDLESRGEFECSNVLLNSIQKCARWSTLTNYHGIPTDCPHREKNGWTGDASLSAEQVLLNFDPVTAYAKWMRDFADVQRPSGQLPGIVPTGGWGFNWGSGPAWDSAMILIPWYVYLYRGDVSLLEDMYENMKRYVDFMTSMSEEGIVDFGLGDWCPPVGGPADHQCPVAVTSTAYYYVDTQIVAKAAALLGKKEDAERYSNLAGNIREAFREKFLDKDTGVVTGNCQTSMACALYQGMVNEDEKPRVLEKLVEQVELKGRHIDCGILGAKYVMHTLSEMGRTDLAYAMATQTDFPSWGHWIAQGATTLWETFAGDASRNHHMFSDISAWFYKGLAGINPDPEEPGFKHIIFKPNPVEGLQWVRSYHKSMYGDIRCNWKVDGDRFMIDISVPVNCRATLYLPDGYREDVRLDGTVIGNKPVIELGSGTYSVTSRKSL